MPADKYARLNYELASKQPETPTESVSEEDSLRDFFAREPYVRALTSRPPLNEPGGSAQTLLGMTPVVGNVMSAYDAYRAGQHLRAASKAGDIREQRKAMTETLLAGLGALSPLPTGRLAGRVANSARDTAPAFPAWHGSPHDYPAERLVKKPDGSLDYLVGSPDRLPDVPHGHEVVQDFPLGRVRLDKIGTGEGAQAYGHGWYAAEHPNVAKSYAEQLGDYSDIVKWKGGEPPTADEQKILNLFKGPAQGGQPTAARVRSDITAMHRTYDPESGVVSLSDEGRRKLALFDSMQDKFELGRPGRLYHTEIDAEPHQLLDWDKPLSEQSEHVKAALDKMGIGNAARGGSVRDIVFGMKAETLDPELQGIQNALSTALARYSKNPTKENGLAYNAANEAFKAVKDRFGVPVPAHEMSKKLNAAGLPGIRYLDQGSRGASGGSTSNYVIFDDKLVKIKRKE